MTGAEKLFDAITAVREDLVEEALDYRFQAKKTIPWQRYAKWAACLALVVCIGYLAANLDLGMGGMNSTADSSGSANGAGDTTGNDTGDSATGNDGAAPEDGGESEAVGSSVVPALSLAEEDSGVTAVRTLALEFYQDGTAIVTDYYTLTNSGETAVTVTLCYEGAGVRACLLNGEEISSGTALTLESGETAEVVLDSAVTLTDDPLTLALPENLEVTEAALVIHNLPDVEAIQGIQGFDQVEIS